MKNVSYLLKLSSQGQLTLPRDLREQLQVKPGSRVTVVAAGTGTLKVSSQLPIEKYFGALRGAWTTDGQDAAEYTRRLRNAMQPKLDREQ